MQEVVRLVFEHLFLSLVPSSILVSLGLIRVEDLLRRPNRSLEPLLTLSRNIFFVTQSKSWDEPEEHSLMVLLLNHFSKIIVIDT